jgi:hypothetical protein
VEALKAASRWSTASSAKLKCANLSFWQEFAADGEWISDDGIEQYAICAHRLAYRSESMQSRKADA